MYQFFIIKNRGLNLPFNIWAVDEEYEKYLAEEERLHEEYEKNLAESLAKLNNK